ncbi:hypothetical protein TNCV_4105791 [Trichonephila clavipes]|nr:hypothetical protein TNCV_4105791 [Trichonephila clavipes]
MAEVIDVKKEHKSVKFLKNIARSNKFLYDKEEASKIGNRNIVFKLPKPQSVDASERQSFSDGFVSMSTMSQRSHLTDSEAWRVVGRLEGGQTQAEVAQAIGVSKSVISRI